MITHPLRIDAARSTPPLAIQSCPDDALMARIAAGDTVAMRALFARHHVRVHRFLVRLVGDHQLAEDLLNEVFLDAWRQAAAFAGRSAASTWLLAIARFKALSRLRQRRESELDETAAAALVDPADDPELTVRKKSRTEILGACLARLSPQHREIIDLVYYQEATIDAAAGILGVPCGTVKTRMFHARRNLSRLLAAAGIDRSAA